MPDYEPSSPFHKRVLPDTSGRAPAPRPYPQPADYDKPYQKVEENALAESLVHIERKTFHLSLKENIRGRLLRITEEAGHNRNTIIVPATGLKEFQAAVAEMLAEDKRTPPKAGHTPPPTPAP